MYSTKDNIVALATYPALSAINVIRCSGPTVYSLYHKITKKTAVPHPNSSHLHLIYCPKNKTLVDQCIITASSKPKSYTGEDMIEFSTHGGEVVARRVLDALLCLNCRLASPGEFTYRAFLSGKIDFRKFMIMRIYSI